MAAIGKVACAPHWSLETGGRGWGRSLVWSPWEGTGEAGYAGLGLTGVTRTVASGCPEVLGPPRAIGAGQVALGMRAREQRWDAGLWALGRLAPTLGQLLFSV